MYMIDYVQVNIMKCHEYIGYWFINGNKGIGNIVMHLVSCNIRNVVYHLGIGLWFYKLISKWELGTFGLVP